MPRRIRGSDASGGSEFSSEAGSQGGPDVSGGYRRRLYLRVVLRIAVMILCAALLVFAAPAVLSILAPFIAAYVLAIILNPIVGYFHKRFNLSRRVSSLVLVILIFGILAGLLSLGIYYGVGEIINLVGNYQEMKLLSSVWDFFRDHLGWIIEGSPELQQTWEDVKESVKGSLVTMAQGLGDKYVGPENNFGEPIRSMATNTIVGIIVFVMASYFISAEYPAIGRILEKYVGNRVYEYMRMLKNTTQLALGRYFKAQAILSLFAFVVMLIALLIARQPYAFLIALFLAMVDFLPILGTAVILVPWAIIEIVLLGELGKGVFLLILSAGFFVLRKFVEPKILGSQTGLHPLIALISIYLGWRVAGIWGAILGPIVVMIAVSVVHTRVFDNTVQDFRDAVYDMAWFFRHRVGASDMIEEDRAGLAEEREKSDEDLGG